MVDRQPNKGDSKEDKHLHHTIQHHNSHHRHHHHHNHHHNAPRANSVEASSGDDKRKFDPDILFEAFEVSLCTNNQLLSTCQQCSNSEIINIADDVNLDDYVRAYKEINKFLECLGNIFYFVITDIRDKIHILECYLRDDHAHYGSIRRAIEYECCEPRTGQARRKNDNSPPVLTITSWNGAASTATASRTILRLHRALLFVHTFLGKLFYADEQHKASTLCIETYEATLGQYHSWLIRKTATFGMRALPHRAQLAKSMCPTEEHTAKFPQFIKSVQSVYDITQDIYTQHDLLDLP